MRQRAGSDARLLPRPALLSAEARLSGEGGCEMREQVKREAAPAVSIAPRFMSGRAGLLRVFP